MLIGVVVRAYIFVNPMQPVKASGPIDVTKLGIVILVNPVQLKKTPPPIDVTKLGIVTFSNPLQL